MCLAVRVCGYEHGASLARKVHRVASGGFEKPGFHRHDLAIVDLETGATVDGQRLGVGIAHDGIA